MQNYNKPEIINIGSGVDYELNEVAKMIAEIINFKGEILHDLSQPDGMKLRRMDVSKMTNLGWHLNIELKDGLKTVIDRIYKTKKHLEW